MHFSRVAAGVFAAMVIGAPGLVLAADNKLTLVIGGEAYDGPPKFTVSIDGKPLGEGAIASAIDTVVAGRFADASDKAKYVQTFDFKIPDDVFKPSGEIRIKLTNEAHGAVGSKNDRELYVQSVAVNGDVVPGTKLSMRSAVGIEPTAVLGDYLVVSEGMTEGVAAAPGNGWPAATVASGDSKPAESPAATAPAAAVATAAPQASSTPNSAPAKPADATGAVADKPADAPVVPAVKSEEMAAAEAAKPEPAATEQSPAKPVTDIAATPTDETPASSGETVETASLNQSPEAGIPTCGLTKSFQILGFNKNSNVLSPRITRQLDDIAKAIGAQKCAVRLTGYSSTEGTFANNALFAIERAQNSLHYLSERGVKFRRYSASGVGETTQFGADPGANRRVVVLVTP